VNRLVASQENTLEILEFTTPQKQLLREIRDAFHKKPSFCKEGLSWFARKHSRRVIRKHSAEVSCSPKLSHCGSIESLP